MTQWIVWGVLLVLQNASHTASSRAKNSRNLKYSTVVSVFSNGIWFFANALSIGVVVKSGGSLPYLIGAGAYYIALTVLGTVASQYFLIRFEDKRGIR